MSAGVETRVGPDLADGVPLADLAEGEPLQGYVGGEAVILIRRGAEVFAVGATCTHHGGPLAEGLVVGDGVRCPWHHACFSIRTGEVLRPPALNPLARYDTETKEGVVRVIGRSEAAPIAPSGGSAAGLECIVILGAGAAGSSAAETLQHEGFEGKIFMIDPDSDAPYDRTTLSKDYLAGTAPEEWIPLRPQGFLAEHRIERIVARAETIDARERRVELSDGTILAYDALILATGSAPIRLPIPGADQPHVHVLRSLADCRAVIRTATRASRAVIAGTSFVGMEAAAALRSRGLQVSVVGPDPTPFARTLGPELGTRFRRLHEAHGVAFHLGRTVDAIQRYRVVLDDGSTLAADLVLLGVGVRPVTDLAKSAGIEPEDGVPVDEYLRTADPRIYAAGDIARFPTPFAMKPVRIEHWVVAQRQGQTAARNVLGFGERFRSVPFFWSRQYDVSVSFIGHVQMPTERRVSGSMVADCRIDYVQDEQVVAVATIGRDRESLEAEAAMEQRTLSAFAVNPAEEKQRATVEAAMDEALRMTFPASDPPAWSCLGSAVPEASTSDPTPRQDKA